MGTQGGVYCSTYVEVREQLVGVRSSNRWPLETNSDHQVKAPLSTDPQGPFLWKLSLAPSWACWVQPTRVLLRSFSKTFPLQNMTEGSDHCQHLIITPLLQQESCWVGLAAIFLLPWCFHPVNPVLLLGYKFPLFLEELRVDSCLLPLQNPHCSICLE